MSDLTPVIEPDLPMVKVSKTLKRRSHKLPKLRSKRTSKPDFDLDVCSRKGAAGIPLY